MTLGKSILKPVEVHVWCFRKPKAEFWVDFGPPGSPKWSQQGPLRAQNALKIAPWKYKMDFKWSPKGNLGRFWVEQQLTTKQPTTNTPQTHKQQPTNHETGPAECAERLNKKKQKKTSNCKQTGAGGMRGAIEY